MDVMVVVVAMPIVMMEEMKSWRSIVGLVDIFALFVDLPGDEEGVNEVTNPNPRVTTRSDKMKIYGVIIKILYPNRMKPNRINNYDDVF
mmetsp:Transcript_11389/g.14349  ORF Transcript_11389/g.14349 Transcript_11389/m.14349 type:complete len:89 (-) Transcript_11389:8-274(-)